MDIQKKRPEVKIGNKVTKALKVPELGEHEYFDPGDWARKMASEVPSHKFPYTYKTIEVHGSKIAYIDEGDATANPIVFVHGAPESAYIWRNVFPYMFPYARVIVPDLIGHGQSDKPAIKYDYLDYQKYLFGTIEALGLKNVTVVGHDWGSVLALDWAATHRDEVSGAVMLECLAAPYYPISDTNKSREERPDKDSVLDHYELFRSEGTVETNLGPMAPSEKQVIEENQFVEFVMHIHSAYEMGQRTMDHYRDPFREPMSRYAIYNWPRMVSLDGDYPVVDKVFLNINDWFLTKDAPTLDIYGKPGEVTQEYDVRWRVENLKNHETNYVGIQLHFVQEDQPEQVGRAIADWYRRNLTDKENTWCTPVTPEHVYYRPDNPIKWTES